LVQIWFIFKIQAFTGRSLGLIAVFVILTLVGRLGTQDLSLSWQILATACAVGLFLACAAAFGRTPDDAVVLDKVTAKIKAKLGR
jgi:hypothetical protein